jgi:hypothetical protein
MSAAVILGAKIIAICFTALVLCVTVLQIVEYTRSLWKHRKLVLLIEDEAVYFYVGKNNLKILNRVFERKEDHISIVN